MLDDQRVFFFNSVGQCQCHCSLAGCSTSAGRKQHLTKEPVVGGGRVEHSRNFKDSLRYIRPFCSAPWEVTCMLHDIHDDEIIDLSCPMQLVLDSFSLSLSLSQLSKSCFFERPAQNMLVKCSQWLATGPGPSGGLRP